MERRGRIINELHTTETTYVNSLTSLIENFRDPLANGHILTPENTSKIFLNSDAILALHKPLLQKLNECLQDPEPKIGDIMAEIVPWLRLYIVYVNGHQEGSDLVEHLHKNDDNFRYALLGCCGGEFSGMLGLASLRLVPVQRIPRYVMLLKDLLQHTEPEHPDYPALSEALASFQNITEEINEKKRSFENRIIAQRYENEIKHRRELLLEDCPDTRPHTWNKIRIYEPSTCVNAGCRKVIGFAKKYMVCKDCGASCHSVCVKSVPAQCGLTASLIKHNRFLLKEGQVKTVRVRLNSGKNTDTGDARTITLILFTDCLLVCDQTSSTEYQLDAVIRWRSPSSQRDIATNQSLQDPKAFVIVAPTDGDIHTFICPDTADRDDWLSKITHAAQEWLTGYYKRLQDNAVIENPAASSLRRTGTISQVSIPHTVPVAGPKGKIFTSYVIDFTDDERGGAVTILKRYSDFDKLHKQLKHQAPKNIKVPNLPSKRFFGDNTDKSFVNSRCSRLEGYLNDILCQPELLTVPCVQEFLEVTNSPNDLGASPDPSPGRGDKSPRKGDKSPRKGDKSPRTMHNTQSAPEFSHEASWNIAAPPSDKPRQIRTTLGPREFNGTP